MRRSDFFKALAILPFATRLLEQRPPYAADVLPKLKGKQDLHIQGASPQAGDSLVWRNGGFRWEPSR